MFISEKINDAVKNYNLLEILYEIKHYDGIDFRLNYDDNAYDQVGVYFMIHNKRHYAILNDIIFNDELEEVEKVDAIMNELIDVFDLEDHPENEFKEAIKKEFEVYEKQDNERVDVSVLTYSVGYNVRVVLTNKETKERREFECLFTRYELGCDLITYENASELGCMVAHDLLDEFGEDEFGEDEFSEDE